MLTAAADGTLVAQLEWTASSDALELDLADKEFDVNQSPTVGRLPVTAGMTYRITVTDDDPWSYADFSAHYALTTVIEQ